MSDAQSPSLPPSLVSLVEEAQRIEAKLKEAAQQAPAVAIAPAQEGLKALKEGIARALAADAAREIAKAGGAAKAIADGKAPVDPPAPGADQKRIAAVEDEAKRIQQKAAKAAENGAKPGDLEPIDKGLQELKKAIAEAAVAAAKRELKAAKDEADAIKHGKPPRPNGSNNGPGPQPQPQPDPPGGGGSSGGGAGAGAGGGTSGDAIDAGIPSTGQSVGKTQKGEPPKPSRIFVKSERTVWAWSRHEQAWVAQHFKSKLVDVRLIDGGILAIAEHGAALFDGAFGEWLPALDSGQETLTGGDAG
jgi:hypothetical protein